MKRILLSIALMMTAITANAQVQSTIVGGCVGNTTVCRAINIDANGNIGISGSISVTGNSAASATGSAVPANAGYTGANVAGTLRGLTATNTSGSVYALDVNVVAGATTGAVTIADGGDATQGAKADAKSTATDTTAITIMQVLKEISFMEQNPASRAVTGTVTANAGTGTFAVSIADAADVTLGAKADAKSTATDTTAVTVMQVLKEISFMEQTPASRAVTNSGTFAVQAAQSGTWVVVGAGTAGSASGGVLTVQGAASMTKLLVTPDANSTVDLNKVGGSAVSNVSGKLGVALFDSTGQNITAVTDPCDGVAKTEFVVNIATNTTTQVAATSSGNKWYICSIDLFASAADNIAFVEDDTAACASPTAGIIGGTTAATGWNFIANQGIVKGNGGGTVYKTAATDRYVCLITSTSAQLSGSVQLVAAP